MCNTASQYKDWTEDRQKRHNKWRTKTLLVGKSVTVNHTLWARKYQFINVTRTRTMKQLSKIDNSAPPAPCLRFRVRPLCGISANIMFQEMAFTWSTTQPVDTHTYEGRISQLLSSWVGTLVHFFYKALHSLRCNVNLSRSKRWGLVIKRQIQLKLVNEVWGHAKVGNCEA